MGILPARNLADRVEGMVAAVGAVVQRLGKLPPPRSLCELCLDRQDYDWLRTWAQNLPLDLVQEWADAVLPRMINVDGDRFTHLEVAGTLLLMVAAETARREAREGLLWPVVEKLFRPEVKSLLFVQGQPSQWHKQALEASAYRLQLRHVFDIEGVQKYYVTVYLQFGLTREGLAQLPMWLSGYQTSSAVDYLLHSTTLASNSFRNLWKQLQAYRHGQISEEKIRKEIATSPWVLPEWEDELLQRAKEWRNLSVATSGDHVELPTLPLLDSPRLYWRPPSDPLFECPIGDVRALDLTDERYDLLIGGNQVGELLRQPDGHYVHQKAIILPVEEIPDVQFEIRLASERGEVVHTGRVVLLNRDAEIAVYSVDSGQYVDPWTQSLDPRKAYVLLTNVDLQVQPRPEYVRLIANGAARLFYLAPGWPPELKVLLDGNVLWEPIIESKCKAIREPEWARQVTLQWTKYSDPTKPLVARVVDVPAGSRVVAARLGGQKLPVSHEGNRFEIGPFSLDPASASPVLRFILCLQHGEKKAWISRELELRQGGLAWCGPDGWEWLHGQRRITVQEAKLAVVRWVLPNHWLSDREHRLALMEGSTFRQWVNKRAGLGETLDGYGGALKLRKGLYNGTDLLQVSSGVTDPGVVSTVYAREGKLYVLLTQPVHPGPAHKVVRWAPGGLPQIYDVIRVVDDRQWEVECPEVDLRSNLIAVAYRGKRLGAWWPSQVHYWLKKVQLSHSIHAKLLAYMIRWSKMPVLLEDWLAAVRAIAVKFPGEFLSAWLLSDDYIDEAKLADNDEAWQMVPRTVFWSFRPSGKEQVDRIVTLLGGGRPDCRIALRKTVLLLGEVSPMLLGRFVNAWRESYGTKMPGTLFEYACSLLGPDVSRQNFHWKLNELLENAARDMQVDSSFLKEGIVRPLLTALDKRDESYLEPLAEENLAIALRFASFRRYCSVVVLQHLSRQS